MTRKRKNIEDESGAGQVAGSARSFPKKEYGGQVQSTAQGGYGGNDFSKQYGYVGGGGADAMLESTLQATEEKTSPFPTEIVTYLRNIDNIRKTEGSIENFVIDKCAEECTGEEATLLSFRDACVVVENVFGSSSYAATLFLHGVCRMKHRRLLDIIFSGCGARTIERLIYAFSPVTTNQQIELLSKLTELICDNWADAVCTSSSSFLVRCIARVSCGLPSKQNTKEFRPKTAIDKPKFTSPALRIELRKVFDRVADLASDPVVTGAILDVPECSLVVQDILDADAAIVGGKAASFVQRAAEAANDQPAQILTSWRGKNSSRVWEKAVGGCSEKSRALLWSSVIQTELEKLASHPSSNYPLQKFISSISSQDLATSVCDVTIPLVPALLTGHRSGVVEALIRCTILFPELQEGLIKQLRAHFRSNKTNNKTHFFFNVLTMNAYDGSSFDVEKSTVPGSLLLTSLMSSPKIKTISACIDAMTYDDIRSMAMHKIASHTLQAALASPTLGSESKKRIIAAFGDFWETLISHPIGSHTFDAIWDSSETDVKTKQDLMKSFVPIHNSSKGWKFAMLKCDMNMFRKDRKGWVEKMKKMKPAKKEVQKEAKKEVKTEVQKEAKKEVKTE